MNTMSLYFEPISYFNFIKFADVVINDVYYDIGRNLMFNTNSQVTVVSYMYCYITIRLNLNRNVIIY